MPGKERSESLFGDIASSQSNSTVPKKRKINPEEAKKQRQEREKAAKNDYIFKNELKDVFDETAKSIESVKNKNTKKPIDRSKTYQIREENSLIKIVNERRKRHYDLNGDIRVYCYIKNEWPKLVIKPLTIRIDEPLQIPSLGPFEREGESLLEVVFRPMTIGLKKKIDPFIYEPQSLETDHISINIDEYKKLSFFCCFKSWNIPIDLPFNNEGRLTEEAFDIINKKIHPLLFDVVSSEFINLNDITEKEVKTLDRQCERLFAKDTKGISNPLEGIKLYCEASAFAKEFSLSGRDLDELPLRVSSMIKHVANKGNEIQSKELDNKKKSPKKAKVIGARGKR